MLALIAQGRSYRLIGREVGLSKNTVAGIVKRSQAHVSDCEFDFERWGNWLEQRAQALRKAGRVAELRRGGPPTPKPCCSFRVQTDRALGQFAVWVTGEADFDVMDARTTEFAHNVWGMALDDGSFEAAFDDFLDRVTQHPIPGRETPASLRSAWFHAESAL